MKLALGPGLLGVALCSFTFTTVAQAEPGISVRWTAPPTCPGESELKNAIELHLGQPLTEARAQSLSVSGEVVRDEGLYAARLRFESGRGLEERTLEHPECGKLFDAAALVIALTIDPGRVSSRGASQPSTEAAVPSSSGAFVEPETVAPSPVEAPPPPAQAPPALPPDRGAGERSRPAGTPLGYELGVFAFVGGGALPGASPGAGAELAVGRRHFELGLGAHYWLPRSQSIPGSEAAEISMSWWSAELRACGIPWLSRWQLRLCAAGGGGDLAGRGLGLSNSRARHTFVPTLSLGARVSFGQGGLSPFAGVAADWLLVRPQYGYAQDSDIIGIYRSSAVAVSGLLGLRFGL